MVDPTEDEETRGKVDAVALLYIFGGIPVIWAFIALVVFIGPKTCNLPA